MRTPRNLAADSRNLLLWRYRAHRLEAEAVRDQMMAVSGKLDRSLYGPPVFPPLAGEVLAQMKNGIWKQQPETYRRSIYVYRKRGLPFPMFEVFDLPDQNLSCAGRIVSTVPTQALTLMNNDFVLARPSSSPPACAKPPSMPPAKWTSLTALPSAVPRALTSPASLPSI